MKNCPNAKDRIIVLIFWFCSFLPAVCSCIFLLAFQDIEVIITVSISVPSTIFASVLVSKVSKGYFLKYWFNQKKFKEQYKETLKHFKGASDAFIKELYNRTHYQYLTTGDIYYYPSMDDEKWLLSDKANIQGLILLTGFLNKAISEKSGFNYFIDSSYGLTHNGRLVIYTLNNRFYSGELRYLLLKVFELTEFNLDDNGLSSEYTEKVNSLRKTLEKEYDALLYNFEDEVESIYLKIKDKVVINESHNDSTVC